MINRQGFVILNLPDFQSFPTLFGLSVPHFVAFLAADFTSVESAAIVDLGARLVRHGCVYFCIWGPGCERAHDLIDESCTTIEPVIMTTWHSDESLEQALWFFAFNAYPDEAYVNAGTGKVAICVGNNTWHTLIQDRLLNLEKLDRDVTNHA
jgi:hypothetical protein